MEFIELKEHESLEFVEVTKRMSVPSFLNPSTGKRNIESDTFEDKRIQMQVFTDGEIEKESEQLIQNIEEYYIGETKYQYDVDTLKSKKIYFKNHSYVITYLIAKEFITKGNISGWFYVVKDVSIYLKDLKDKKALRSAKKAIKDIEKRNNSADYTSIFAMLFSEEKEKIETENISTNVYRLKK